MCPMAETGVAIECVARSRARLVEARRSRCPLAKNLAKKIAKKFAKNININININPLLTLKRANRGPLLAASNAGLDLTITQTIGASLLDVVISN